ncbi:hypothetical protein SUGI_0109890 [Cryptomeria japonica]|uniref:probable aspartic proteinase GIP2 n=1 Tax=Cryptomeria japonica TaxID=3369 RepID=UPI002408E467|nr:probable aspartic proteinase GIP2 [Cryptomeria japonica]GLJ09448.1 hypothetical protein SUGI_0109890 [Cryptomeria japonica]
MTCLAVLFFFFLYWASSIPSSTTRIITMAAPLWKDPTTLQYVMEFEHKTPLRKDRVVIDLAGDFLWLHCKTAAYQSSTYLFVPCRTPLCTASGSAIFGCGDCSNIPPGPKSCRNDTCQEVVTNGVREIFNAELSQDTFALYPSDGKRASLASKIVVPQFAFACAPSSLLQGLAKGAMGMAGLNRGWLALPFQLNVALELDRKFGLCLPAGDAPGAVFFGGPPYLRGPDKEYPYIKLNYTFLLTPRYPREYYLNVQSIEINGKRLPIDAEQLKLNLQGSRGTKLSTVVTYTQAATPIYTAIRDGFVREAEEMGISRVESVKPFDACFDATTVGSTKTGPAVPVIDLVLDNEYVFWRIHGVNSMVNVKDGVMCLAFVDAGKYSTESILVGSHQLQDNLLQFDLIEFKLFFSSSLLASNTNCSNFVFA